MQQQLHREDPAPDRRGARARRGDRDRPRWRACAQGLLAAGREADASRLRAFINAAASAS